MWSRKRILKKEQKKRNKKRILFFSILSALVGILLIGVGIVVLMHEPVFISPLPLKQSFGGSTEEDEIKQSIIRLLKEQKISYTNLKQLSKTTYFLQLKENGDVFLTAEKDISEQLASLQKILSRLTMDGKKFVRLDLRYDKPVIVLQ